MPRITIDGASYWVGNGALLLDVLDDCGIAVPQACHDRRLQPSGACRLCLVEVKGQPRPVPSCTTRVDDGMDIRTDTPALDALRRTNLSLIAAFYPDEAILKEPQRPFHRLLNGYGVRGGNRPPARSHHEEAHPYIGVAMDRCIHCYRCVRICEELQGQFVWEIVGRGEHTHVAPAGGRTMIEGGCVSCGACADTCPTGALFDKRSPSHAAGWTRTTCPYCAVGCQIDAAASSGKVVAVRPVDHPTNKGHLCVKGRYAFDFQHAADRVTTPLIRRDGIWQEASWEEALGLVAERLDTIRRAEEADRIGVLASSRATNEECYLAQKFARVVIGTHNVDCCARVCHTPSAKALKTMLGTGAATNGFDDIELARAFLLCGANPTENHPVVGARIKQAVMHGAKLVVVDPRRTELCSYADVHLAILPGTDVPLFNAMAATLIEEDRIDHAFMADRVSGFDEFSRFIMDYLPERVAPVCGVQAGAIRQAARIYADAAPAMCFHGLGVTEHMQGTEGVMALINLALLTGNLGRSGSGVNPLRGQNNVQGAALMGCEPNSLTGSQSIRLARGKFEARWNCTLPASHGLNLLEMMDSARNGNLKALWVQGYDIYLSLAHEAATRDALDRLDLLVVQDLFLTETARAFATVFLPAASSFEKDGTFTNSDRRIHRVRCVVPPPGQALPDWQIIQRLARKMGHADGFAFESPRAIWDEVRGLWPDGAGLSYERLERECLHWPCPDEAHPGTPYLHASSFGAGKSAGLARISFVASPETVTEDYPFLLTTGRSLYQFNVGTMTGRTENQRLHGTDSLDMGIDDANRLHLHNGDHVRIESRYGATTLPLRVTEGLRAGILFTTFHHPSLFVNMLTSDVRDREVDTPEYKLVAVRIAR